MRICVVRIEETQLDEISRIDKATVCASRIQLGNFLIIARLVHAGVETASKGDLL